MLIVTEFRRELLQHSSNLYSHFNNTFRYGIFLHSWQTESITPFQWKVIDKQSQIIY